MNHASPCPRPPNTNREGEMMAKDRYERRHRKTVKNPEAMAVMANANPDAVPPLSDALSRPLNFVAEVNGHHIYRHEDGVRCDLWTPGVGWWGFGLSEAIARRQCEIVTPAARPTTRT